MSRGPWEGTDRDDPGANDEVDPVDVAASDLLDAELGAPEAAGSTLTTVPAAHAAGVEAGRAEPIEAVEAVAARLEGMRRARVALRAPLPAPAGAADDAVTAALAALDDAPETRNDGANRNDGADGNDSDERTHREPTGGTVVPMRGRRPVSTRWLGAAAAAAILALGAAMVASGGFGDGDAETATLQADADLGEAAEAGTDGSAGLDAAELPTAESADGVADDDAFTLHADALSDLGAFDDLEDLAAAVRSSLGDRSLEDRALEDDARAEPRVEIGAPDSGGTATTASPTAGAGAPPAPTDDGSDPCAATLAVVTGGQVPAFDRTATFQGRPVRVVVPGPDGSAPDGEAADRGAEVVVLDPFAEGCPVLGRRALDP